MPRCSLMSMGTPLFISKLKFSYDKYSVDKVWTKIYCHFYFRGVTLRGTNYARGAIGSLRSLHLIWDLRWLNRVMQDHEARASDLNLKVQVAPAELTASRKQRKTIFITSFSNLPVSGKLYTTCLWLNFVFFRSLNKIKKTPINKRSLKTFCINSR